MPNYRVEINGQNFLVEMEGRVARYGFVTVHFVEAADRVAAEYAAVEMIRETHRLRDIVRNTPEDHPIMDVTEVDEVETLPAIDERGPGFIWYEEHPKRWWQFWRR